MRQPITQRLILKALGPKGQLTSRGIAVAIGIEYRNASNICSLMAAAGLLVENPSATGGRSPILYSRGVEVLPNDLARIADLVTAYGRKAVMGLVKAAEVTA